MVAAYGEIAEIEEFLGCGGLQSSISDLAALSEAGFEPVTVGYTLGESGLTRRETWCRRAFPA
jgi:hypothetical protein